MSDLTGVDSVYTRKAYIAVQLAVWQKMSKILDVYAMDWN